MIIRILFIFLGGGLGSVLRYIVSGYFQRFTDSNFPLGTLGVNFIGCILIGLLASLLTGPVLIREEYRIAILVGLLGGFTTFSTFTWESLTLTGGGQYLWAILNIVLSNILGLAAAWAGSRLTMMIYGC